MYLDNLQSINNFLYKMFGYRNFILNIQVYINVKRNEKDIPDSSEILLYDGDKAIVQ